MRIKELWIKNFRGYGENPDDKEQYFRFVDLDKHDLIILNGFNGFGKTSFFDAIEWCLTNSISRIEEKKDVLYIKNLKASHYLKFTNGNSEKDNHRKVEVVIIFDDGTFIKRISNASSLHEAGYAKNTFVVDNSGNKYDINELWQKIIIGKQVNSSEFINISCLGQENINSFLRSRNPIQRTQSLMKLIGHSRLSQIVEESKTTNFKKLGTTITTISNKLEDVKEAEERINSIFQQNKWGEIDQYIKKVSYMIKGLKEFEEQLIFRERWNVFELLKNIDKINIENLIFILDNCVKKYTLLINEKSELNQKYKDLIEFRLITHVSQKQQNISSINFIEEKDFLNLIKDKKTYEDKKEYYNACLNNINEESQKLFRYKGMWENVISNIDINKYSIDTKFWTEILKLCNKYTEFIKLKNKYFICNNSLDFSKKVEYDLWEYRRNKYDKYVKVLKIVGDKIRQNDKLIKALSVQNNKYNDMLVTVRDYIFSEKTISSCPVCFNKNINNIDNLDVNLSIKDKLLIIIDNTIADGNYELKELNIKNSKIKKRYQRLLDSLKSYILQPIMNDISLLEEKFNEEYLNINSKICSQEKCIKKHCKFYDSIGELNNEQIKEYKIQYKNILKKEITVESVDDINELIKMKKSILLKQIEKIKKILQNNINPFYILTSDEVQKRINDLNEKIQKFSINENSYKKIKKLINELDQLVIEFEKIKEYEIKDQSDRTKLDTYFKLKKYQGDLEKSLAEFISINEDQIHLEKNSEYIQNDAISIILRKNAMVQWVYSQINPHPFFREIEFDYDKVEGTNLKQRDIDNIFLDHIFSSAQLNVLALSIFLGLSLTQKCSNFDQIMLDDPIQSMDDINVLSYVDLLRGILNSKKINKSFIISTHDNNFANLLSIKFRNRDYIIYNFDSYGKEGPRYSIINT